MEQKLESMVAASIYRGLPRECNVGAPCIRIVLSGTLSYYSKSKFCRDDKSNCQPSSLCTSREITASQLQEIHCSRQGLRDYITLGLYSEVASLSHTNNQWLITSEVT